MGNAQDSIAIEDKARAASRRKLVLIFALFFVPLLLATIWMHLVKSSGGGWGNTSRGELISPAVPFEPFTLVESGTDDAFNLDEVRGKWTILYVPELPCGKQCEETLYNIRQARLALNHRMERVQRAIVVADPAALGRELLAEHPGLRVVSGDAGALAGFTTQVEAAQSALEPKSGLVYLIDPLGNLMMRYTADKLPRPLFKDLKHLLKVSRIG